METRDEKSITHACKSGHCEKCNGEETVHRGTLKGVVTKVSIKCICSCHQP